MQNSYYLIDLIEDSRLSHQSNQSSVILAPVNGRTSRKAGFSFLLPIG